MNEQTNEIKDYKKKPEKFILLFSGAIKLYAIYIANVTVTAYYFFSNFSGFVLIGGGRWLKSVTHNNWEKWFMNMVKIYGSTFNFIHVRIPKSYESTLLCFINGFGALTMTDVKYKINHRLNNRFSPNDLIKFTRIHFK